MGLVAKNKEKRMIRGNKFIVGVLSDTHVYDKTTRLPPSLVELLRGVDIIIHAGDISTPSVLEELEKIAPVYAVLGNKVDDQNNFKSVLHEYIELNIKGLNIIVTHGSDSINYNLDSYLGRDLNDRNVMKRTVYVLKKVIKKLGFKKYSNYLILRRLKRLYGKRADCIIFGHTHVPFAKEINNILYFNPGDAQYTRKKTIHAGLLEVEDKEISNKLLTIKLP